MKRGTILILLLLMIVTSLNAGTVAIYSSTVDTAVLDVSAKRFILDVNKGDQVELNLKLAPSEHIAYDFTVTNTNTNGDVSEVGMDLLIQADFSAVCSTIPDIQIQLMRYSTSGYSVVSTVGSDGQLNYSQRSGFTALQSKEERFSLVFYWEDGENARAVINGSRIVLPLALYVKGVQHVD